MRGCGTRKQGGIYAESNTSEGGRPIEDFIFCAPIILDYEALGITPIGVKLIEIDGVHHIFDWVGASNYPNVLDFIEEVRVMGLSRRLPKTLDFSKITKNTCHYLIHPKSFINEWARFVEASKEMHDPIYSCMKEPDAPFVNKTNCCGGWHHDIDPKTKGFSFDGHKVFTPVPKVSYAGHVTATDTVTHTPALFMALPLTNIAVIEGEAGEHKDALDKTSTSGIDVILYNE